MDVGKLKSLSVGDLVARAQALAEKLAPTDPDFANDLALSLVKGLVNGNEDLSSIVSLFGSDDDISGGLFPEEPVTVTKTTTSVGGNIDPDEAAKAIQNAGGEPAASDTELAGGTTPEEDDASAYMEALMNGSDEDIQAAAAKLGIEPELSTELAGDTTPEEDTMLKQAEKNASQEEKPAEEKQTTEEKPAEKKEEPPKEDKPKEEKKEEPKADKPAEDKKDESDDTMKNITSALSNRI